MSRVSYLGMVPTPNTVTSLLYSWTCLQQTVEVMNQIHIWLGRQVAARRKVGLLLKHRSSASDGLCADVCFEEISGTKLARTSSSAWCQERTFACLQEVTPEALGPLCQITVPIFEPANIMNWNWLGYALEREFAQIFDINKILDCAADTFTY
jgi:hypothetical protein